MSNATAAQPRTECTFWYAAAAALLVFNSHLEALYPRPWLAGDGLLGNSMFFFLSGWGLACSWGARQRTFLNFMSRRVGRIYPTLIVCVLLLAWAPEYGWSTWTPRHYLERFIFPTEFTYVRVIMPAYIVLYFVLRGQLIDLVPLMVGLLATVYAIAYLQFVNSTGLSTASLGMIPERFHFAYYLALVLSGAFAAGKRPPRLRSSSTIIVATAILATLIYLAAKLRMAWTESGQFFPLLHILCYSSVITLFAACKPIYDWLTWTLVHKVLHFLGVLTLEIYLIHELLLKSNWLAIGYQHFPFEILALLLSTLILSTLLHAALSATARALFQTPLAKSTAS